MAVARPALDLGSRDHLVSRAVERGIQRNDLLLEGAGACDGLENRTGVVQLGYSLVLPLLLTERRLLGVELLLGGAGFLHLGKGLEIEAGFKLRRVVQVEAGSGRHREDGSGIAVHYDTTGAVYYLVLGNAQLQVLFKVVLEHLVQREHQAVAVHG